MESSTLETGRPAPLQHISSITPASEPAAIAPNKAATVNPQATWGVVPPADAAMASTVGVTLGHGAQI